jgi:hypothetical protein
MDQHGRTFGIEVSIWEPFIRIPEYYAGTAFKNPQSWGEVMGPQVAVARS